MSPPIRIVNLHKTYRRSDRRPALCGVSAEVMAGELAVLMGPNGAGKTTLIKILATLIRPDQGEVWVAGHPLAAGATVRRHLGVVTEAERSLFWRLDARQNLDVFGRGYGLRGRELRRRIEIGLEAVGLTGVAHLPVGKLSAGQRTLLALARALLPQPTVLLLDEPTRSLDVAANRRFVDLLRDYLAMTPEAAVLIATHQPEAVAALCRRLLVLREGHAVAQDAPAALLAAAGLPAGPSAAEDLRRLYVHWVGV
ncbi:MAG: ABC transporter ATP-binding protein [Anaerolineae bacterium]|nr:ABC transporter ATP-binding protein [Caldilineales bacterium]MCX7853556.1 ABC transporter ATP-binding protein [Caldilineales bacterium]MDW8268227.1 ABC transporter ATP-binding protein [Anaerolineae bacterium]